MTLLHDINMFTISAKITTFTISVKVPSSITVLILHLALCDLLYCIIGMPYQMSIYTNSYLKYLTTFGDFGFDVRFQRILVFLCLGRLDEELDRLLRHVDHDGHCPHPLHLHHLIPGECGSTPSFLWSTFVLMCTSLSFITFQTTVITCYQDNNVLWLSVLDKG